MRNASVFTLLFVFFFPHLGFSAWYADLNWKYRQKITISSTVTPATLSNFPYLVKIVDAGNSLFTNAQTNGDDILFTLSNGTTKLDHEIEYYSSGGELWAWVKIPSLPSGSDTELYVYYGYPTATNQESIASVWSNGYAAVYHLHGDFNDSVGAHPGTNSGSFNATGQIADGQEFAPQGGVDSVALGTWNVSGNQLTIQGWVSPDTFTQDDPRVLDKATSPAEQDHVWMLSLVNGSSGENRLRGRLKTGTSDVSGTTTLIASAGAGDLSTAGQWAHAAMTYDGSTMRLVKNGSNAGSVAKSGNLRQNSWVGTIGNNANSTNQSVYSWDGKLDEVRISAAARSLNWLTAETRNQGAPATYQSLAAEETVISGTVYTDEGVITIADGATVNLLVNGASVGTDTTTSGVYSIGAPSLAANNTILAYIDGHASKGTTVSVSDGSALTGFDIYAAHIITRHDYSGALSNANMTTAKSADTDIEYSVSGAALTVGSGVELHIPTGHSFTPGGDVTTQGTGGNVDIRGTVTAGANIFTVAGDWANTGTFTANTSTIIFNDSVDAIFTPGASANYKNITVNKAAQINSVTLSTNALTLGSSSALTLTTGILDLAGNNLDLGTGSAFSNTGTLRLQGGETLSNFTNDINSGTIEYNGSGNYTGLKAGNAYHHLGFSGTGVWTLDAALDTAADFTITSGTVDTSGSSHAVNVAGNWTNNGAFTAQTGTVNLDGSGQSIAGSTTFHSLTKSVASAETLTFAAGSTLAINGTVTLKGVSGNLLSLISSSPGTHWNFNVAAGATKTIDWVDCSWSDASGSAASQKPIEPPNSTDGGNTIDWFGAPDFLIVKASTTLSDPVNGGTNPKAIPGAVVEYSVIVTNNGDGSADAGTVFLTDNLDNGTLAYDVTTGVVFADGTTSSGLSLGTVTYSDEASPGPYTYDHTPVPDGDGFDGNITSIKINTTGTFAFGGAPAPSFTVKFRVRVK